jgi:hypothetical protein
MMDEKEGFRDREDDSRIVSVRGAETCFDVFAVCSEELCSLVTGRSSSSGPTMVIGTRRRFGAGAG